MPKFINIAKMHQPPPSPANTRSLSRTPSAPTHGEHLIRCVNGLTHTFQHRQKLDNDAIQRARSNAKRQDDYRTGTVEDQLVILHAAVVNEEAKRKRSGIHTSSFFDEAGVPLAGLAHHGPKISWNTSPASSLPSQSCPPFSRVSHRLRDKQRNAAAMESDTDDTEHDSANEDDNDSEREGDDEEEDGDDNDDDDDDPDLDVPALSTGRAYGFTAGDSLFHVYLPNNQLLGRIDGATTEKNSVGDLTEPVDSQSFVRRAFEIEEINPLFRVVLPDGSVLGGWRQAKQAVEEASQKANHAARASKDVVMEDAASDEKCAAGLKRKGEGIDIELPLPKKQLTKTFLHPFAWSTGRDKGRMGPVKYAQEAYRKTRSGL